MNQWFRVLAGQRTLMCYVGVTLMTFDRQSNGRRIEVNSKSPRNCNHRIFLPRDAMRKRGLCCRPVSVRLSVTLVHCIQTAQTSLSAR